MQRTEVVADALSTVSALVFLFWWVWVARKHRR
jgi:hypothetical protein